VKIRNDPFIREVIALIRAIPRGRVATYGQIAALAGDPRGARQVVRTLHACSEKERLPWHRVVNARGGISLRPGRGGEEQARRLKAEGLAFNAGGRLDLDAYQWDHWARRTRRRGKSFLGLDLGELRRRQK
jgi:methylated-DNA-protein-cysteine methyltransferase-like protein